MTAIAGQERFFVDESALGLGHALVAARRDTICAGHALIPLAPVGTPDPLWMQEVAKRDLIVIARDKRIRTKPAEIEAFVKLGLRSFWLGGKHDKSTWEYLVLAVRMWERMEKTIEVTGPGPWMFSITDGGLTRIDLNRKRRP